MATKQLEGILETTSTVEQTGMYTGVPEYMPKPEILYTPIKDVSGLNALLGRSGCGMCKHTFL